MKDSALGGKLLEGVSRSFYLTLKALPVGVREPISLGYLLARAADTLADTPSIDGAVKTACLEEFGRLVQTGERDSRGEAALCDRLKRAFVPLQEDAAEARLLERLPEALEALHASPERQTEAIRGVLDPIVRGQLLDIRRFPVDGTLRSLESAAELEEYTHLVAGCVGEFWSKVCASEVAGAFDSAVGMDAMVQLGVRYGKGLQLVNILRDIGKDAGMGRCYFPAEELAAQGLSLEDVQRDPGQLVPVMRPWMQRCREHLEQGLTYVNAVAHRRLRYATALPLALGFRTLARIEKATPAELVHGVKVPRSEVAALLFRAGLANLTRRGMRRWMETQSRHRG